MNSYQRYMAAIESGTVGESFVRGLRMALHSADRRSMGLSVSATAAKISIPEATNLLIALAQITPRIDEKQTAKGLAWLRSPKVQRMLGERERKIVSDFDHFTLSGMWDAGRNGIKFYLPVYDVHATDGRKFSYYAGSWQSGKAPLAIIA